MSSVKRASARFGTFGGVFTPSCLTILGVIMFMRAGYVVGEAGIWRALLILLLAKSITTLTSLSLSAIATNTEVGTGGNYFLISRTLGPDFGGTIGITLFLSQAVAIAFYIIGFSEALFGLLVPRGSEHAAWVAANNIEQLTSSGVIVLLFALTFKGADVALKAQFVILAILLASVASFVVGGIIGFEPGNFEANAGLAPETIGFWTAFAIFFPAATGIEAGANMSGDLKDPARSIPRGTLIAVGFTAVIYALELVLLAGYADRAALRDDPFGTLQQMSVFGPLVFAGVFAGTLSSALGSFLGAPRILQSMGNDRLLKPLVYFGRGHGPANEPRRATVLSLFIALAVVWLGNLDAVAEIISMFFLIAYGMMNVSAFVEARSGNPSFRPRFRAFGWPAALVGAIGCAVAMVKIDETYAIVAMLLSTAIYVSLRGRTAAGWGDAKRGYVFARARQNLLALEKTVVDPKNWRPMIAVLTDDAERDRRTLECAALIESGRGILSVLEIRGSDVVDPMERARLRHERTRTLRETLGTRKLTGFAEALVVPDPEVAAEAAIQAHSIGGLRPNTLLARLPPPSQGARRQSLAASLRCAAAEDMNVAQYKSAGGEALGRNRIDVWWHGRENGSLMALFAYLIASNPGWDNAQIRTVRVVDSASDQVDAERDLAELMKAARLANNVEVVLSQRPVSEIIVERSASADLVMLGLAPHDLLDFEDCLARRDALLAELPSVLLVRSNGQVDLLA